MTPDDVKAIVLSYPGAEEGTSYGAPSWKVNGKFFTRLRREDQSLVLTLVSFDEREMLMEAEPATFHITPHYKDYPAILARIETLHPGSLANFLDRKFRQTAKAAVVKAWDAARTRTD